MEARREALGPARERALKSGELAGGRRGDDPETPRGHRSRSGLEFFERVRIPGWLTALLLVAESVVTTVLLNTVVPEVVDLSGELEAVAVSAGVAVGFQLASLVAGRALAAVRLPLRLAALSLFVLFVAGAVVLLPALEQLRELDDAGLVALTALTGLSGLSTATLSYASAVYAGARRARQLLAEEDALVAATPTELRLALQRLEEALATRDEVRTELQALVARIDALRTTIVEKRTHAARAPERLERLEATRQELLAGLSTLTLRAETYAQQEHAYARATLANAEIAHAVAMLEQQPEDEPVPVPPATEPTAGLSRHLRTGLLAGAGLLGAGAVTGAVAQEALIYAAGAGLAAIAVIAGLLASRREPAPEPAEAPRVPGRIEGAPGGEEFVTQPNHYV